MLELRDYQLEAIKKLHNGSILCGSVGSGKSRTALAYYYICVGQGSMKINGYGNYEPMKFPKDLYIITTAKKRDSHEWEDELYSFILEDIKVTVDSWNNIKKYRDVTCAFFIFDEQRVIGSGAWVKAFLNITRKNRWILLSATPGDKWTDYIPCFIANGFYKNKTEFQREHVIYDPYVTKYPKIKGYVNEGILIKHRKEILVTMKDERHTERHDVHIPVGYPRELYRQVWQDRWNIYDHEPIQEVGKLCYLARRVVNSDPSRIIAVFEILHEHPKAIIFYNFDYELEILREFMEDCGYVYSEWNGHKHERVPTGDKWCYLVQYTAGAEGWNCITTDTIIFYSANYSYRATLQSRGRIDRMNTPYKDLYYYMLESTAPIDRSIRMALKKGKDFNEKAFMDARAVHKKQK